MEMFHNRKKRVSAISWTNFSLKAADWFYFFSISMEYFWSIFCKTMNSEHALFLFFFPKSISTGRDPNSCLSLQSEIAKGYLPVRLSTAHKEGWRGRKNPPSSLSPHRCLLSSVQHHFCTLLEPLVRKRFLLILLLYQINNLSTFFFLKKYYPFFV